MNRQALPQVQQAECVSGTFGAEFRDDIGSQNGLGYTRATTDRYPACSYRRVAMVVMFKECFATFRDSRLLYSAEPLPPPSLMLCETAGAVEAMGCPDGG